MPSSVQEIEGVERALNRLEDRLKAYRDVLIDRFRTAPELKSSELADIAVSEGEVETIEALISNLSVRITGKEPEFAVWEPLHFYVRERAVKNWDTWIEHQIEYLRWALLWVHKTRSYIDYLGGTNAAEGRRVIDTPNDELTSNEGQGYDVVLSFAGEDRNHAREIARLTTQSGFSVFFDEYEKATLWGKNLYTHLSDIYTNKGKYCLMFISNNYARKLWTKREREAAQARAFRENSEYILPLRLDDTILPGVDETVGYIDLRHTPYEEVVHLLASKLRARLG